jgi:glutamine---fructose-6-phosphate transaminase (isomerizing)
MCGIVAVLSRPSCARAPEPSEILAKLEGVAAQMGSDGPVDGRVVLEGSAAVVLAAVDARLRGPSGLRCLLMPGVADKLEALAGLITSRVKDFEACLEHDLRGMPAGRLEEVNVGLTRLLDCLWSIGRDRVAMARAVADLLEGRPAEEVANLDGWWAIQVALASLDRLEVRGRDSAGLHVLVAGHGLEPAREELDRVLSERGGDTLYRNGSVRAVDGCLSFVYKAAAEIGELGDNVRVLRRAIRADGFLARAIENPGCRVTVLGHTRWASVGIISEPNAHPVNSEEMDGPAGPFVVTALNGDVDNHLDLRRAEGLVCSPQVTTDAKVIPVMFSRRLAGGSEVDEAFRAAVANLQGSVAVAASAAASPDRLHLALAGSGQSLYVGLAEDAFVVASEPYGVVEETGHYVRMDGDRSGGEVLVLTRAGAGTAAGMTRVRYTGAVVPVRDEDVVAAEIRTRDVDRRGFDHFLIKELTEAPASFRKTLRGRIVADGNGRWVARVGP